MLLLSSISIFYERSKDVNNKGKNLKTKIYYMVLKIMLQRIYSSFFFIDVKKKNIKNTAVLLEHKDCIELICEDSYKRYWYFVLAGIMMDYKKQVFIIGIKTNM